jgi:hypothetical protein
MSSALSTNSYGVMKCHPDSATQAGPYTWTRVTRRPSHPPYWNTLLVYACDFYEQITGNEATNAVAWTSEGNFLVAELGDPYQGGCITFDSTIPRGEYRKEVRRLSAEHLAPEWAAANSERNSRNQAVRHGVKSVHAEDGVIYQYLLAIFDSIDDIDLPRKIGALQMGCLRHQENDDKTLP